ncbi:Ppx/GppA phosphatase family protein [uncultured Desulfuromonas sp.]|uniref:Ppx/GppA phosphatase family protein n=1 Tax=uncultured Desulfuromonas sp. TaxID=181013 RepID=UPI00260DCFA3|nr:Ppx/GppA phosphatase family protein [uncultured Desulfuromonas sp.]
MSSSSEKRLAAIDIGTNSIRCIVVEVTGYNDFRILDDEKATVRLGEGLFAGGSISPDAWERAREALLRMRMIIEGLGAGFVEAVATSAVRKARNGREFIVAMKAEAGVDIRVIDGKEEAQLAATSAYHNFDMGGRRYAMVDIGGGSAEVVISAGNHVEEIHSLDLGAVYLSERFVRTDPISSGEFADLRKYLRKSLKQALKGPDASLQTLVGSGGTITAIGAMTMAMREERYDSMHGYEVLRSEVVHLLSMLERMTFKERRALQGLNPERADIIVAGVAVINELMRRLGSNVLKVNERGLREGLILESLWKHGLIERRAHPRDWRDSIRDFARSCHVDMNHGEQVRKLALRLFKPLAEPFGLDKRSGQMLEAAALLHDVGYFINYSKHHKHSYHLIRHADLFDFSPREKEVVANLARYHRKALPRLRHENFAGLSPEDRTLVKRLGGILRLADGLDRRRSQVVEGVSCALEEEAFSVAVEGEGDLSVEVFGGRGKGDLFEEAFGLRLDIAASSH